MPKTPRPLNVLIVDDSALMREGLSALFQTVPGVEVVGVAENAPAAIRRIRAGGVDAVTLDLDLDGESGVDVLKAIKADPAAPVFIVLTIHSFSELGAHCQAAGADYYFEKAGSLDGVLNLLGGLAERHAAELP
jgi:DNA-binding NarL/FixJ family response regulator